MVSVVGLTGCVAALAVDLLVRAKDDQIAKRLEYAEPLPKNGLGVGAGQGTTFSRVFRGSSLISTNICVISNTLCVLHCQKNNQNAAEHSQKSPVAARENGILTSLCSFWVCAGPGCRGSLPVSGKNRRNPGPRPGTSRDFLTVTDFGGGS